MAKKRSAWSAIQRDLYFTQRTMGDFSAAKHGTLGKRLVRRSLIRDFWRVFR
jgi:hypothetical protein